MLKLIGGIMIFSGCFGLGFWYREQLRGRVRALRLLQQILELLASEVRYGRAALPECCRHVSAKLPPPFDRAFGQVAEKMQENTGDSFAEVLCSGLREPLSGLPLKEEDREIFCRFAPQTGFVDGQMQLRVMEQSCQALGATAERLEGENAEKCRMAVGLGAMGGLLLILVLW